MRNSFFCRMLHGNNLFHPALLFRKLATLLVIVFLLALTVGCGTPVKKSANSSSTIPSPTLFMLSQGTLESYQADGKQNWQIQAASMGSVNSENAHTHLINSGTVLYTATDILQATTLTGKVLWHQSLPAQADDLLLTKQNLYVLADGALSAWNSTQGKLLWQQQGLVLPFGPWAALVSDGQYLFLGGENLVVALDVLTGKIVWHQDISPGDGVEQFFIKHTILLAQTGTSIIAFQSSTGSILWQRDSQIKSLYINQAGTILYTFSIDVPDPISDPNTPIWSGLRAVNLATGKQLWAVTRPDDIEGVSTISSSGILYHDATSITAWNLQGKQLWQNAYANAPIAQIDPIPQAHIALIIEEDGTLLALDDLNGKQQWQQTLLQGSSNQFAIQQQQCWIISPEDGDINAYSFQGKRQWSLKLNAFEDLNIQ